MIHIYFHNEPCANKPKNPSKEIVLDLTISHEEGCAALAHITVPQHAYTELWCSIFDEEILLFVGQKVSLKERETDQKKTLIYRAWQASPIIPAHLPYDDLFFDETDTSRFLEASPYFYYFDRCTGASRLSHMLYGKQTVHLQNILKIETAIQGTPYSEAHINLECSWIQRHSDTFDLMPSIHAACTAGRLNTLTPGSITSSWPKDGPFLRNKKGETNGYTVIESELRTYKPRSTGLLDIYPEQAYIATEPEQNVERVWFDGHIWLRWQYQQPRVEQINFSLNANLRDAYRSGTVYCANWKLKPPRTEELLPTSASFFNTTRGQQAIKYAVKLAHQRLAISARCITTKITVPFSELCNIHLDASVTWHGKTGKVSGYKFFSRYGKSYGEVYVKQSLHQQTSTEQHNQTNNIQPSYDWKPIQPKGLQSKKPPTMVEELRVENMVADQIKHVEEGGELSTCPTRIYVRLLELGSAKPLLEEVSLGCIKI